MEWEDLEISSHHQIRFTSDRAGQNVLAIFDLNDVGYDFGTIVDLSTWRNVWATFYWSVATFDADDRPGPWCASHELTKIGHHRVAALGDSITYGECVENAYLDILADRLRPRWGDVTMVNVSEPGVKTKWGADHIETILKTHCPEFILILFGANDSVDPYGCDPPYECNPHEHLQTMVEIAWNRGTIPIISTILPVNPDEKHAGAQWRVDMYNEAIIDMANRIYAPWVDLNAMFWAYGDDMPSLFCDWGHPSYKGYEIMSEGYYEGIISHGG